LKVDGDHHFIREKAQRIRFDLIVSAQELQLSEIAKLRWDGASELIRGDVPKRAT